MREKVPHVMVNLWTIFKKIPRILVIHNGSRGDKKSRVLEMTWRTRGQKDKGEVMREQ